MEAKIILSKCNTHNHIFGVRVEKRENDWVRTWAFKVDYANTQNEDYSTGSISGTFGKTQEYPGCPYCKAESFLTCSNCGKWTCIEWGSQTGYCRWCDPHIKYDNLEWGTWNLEAKSGSDV